jgi:TolB-like protein/Flp pilus assembly protein TadD
VTLAAGTKLGPYEILAPLGAGGMGEVYRAKDTKLERDVAVKVLPAHLTSDPDALGRFEREAKAVASLSHPNILAIHDFGTHAGVSYAVTELLEGETLRGRIDAGTISQRQAVDWAQQIAKGLSAAHGKGVVHRDLKPENVFVTGDGNVKILDFGLVKRLEGRPEEQTSAPTDTGHTAPGTVMGTVAYMSPEQVRGLPVDHRSDIFSFGAVLYEMLSGQKAFKRHTASDTIAAILKEEPQELTHSGKNISASLDHIVRHCLEKDREDRFQSARDLAFDLSEASGALSATASGSYAPAKPLTRNRVLLAVAAAFVVAAAGFLLWKQSRPEATAPGIKRIAVLPFENLGAPEDDYFADGIADQIRGKLTAVPGILVIARSSSTPYKKTTKTSQEIARELSANYLLTATVRWQKSGGANRVQVNPELVEILSDGPPASKWQQSFDAALTDVFQVQSDVASRVAGALGVALAEGQKKELAEKPTQNLAAYDAFLKGEEASNAMAANDPGSLRQALSFYEQTVALDAGFAEAWARVSAAAGLLYANSTPRPELFERARTAAEKAITLAPTRPEGYQALGNYQRILLNDPRAAMETYAKALRLAPNDVRVLGSTVWAEMSLGLWDAALKHATEAARLDPRSVSANRILGLTLIYRRRYAEAREAFERALALAPANLAATGYKTATFLGQGDLPGARAFLRSASKSVEPTRLVVWMALDNDLSWVLEEADRELLLRLTPDAFDGDRALWGICLAQVSGWKGDQANAHRYAEEARKAVEDQLRQTTDDSQRHALLGLALAYLGRKEEAIREGQRSVSLMTISKDAYLGPYIQFQLVRIFILVGEHEKAIDLVEPLLKIPYFVSPAWLKIDPNFDRLRGNPRFQKLVSGGASP